MCIRITNAGIRALRLDLHKSRLLQLVLQTFRQHINQENRKIDNISPIVVA